MKKVAILQSNYIPWKGYFDMIAFVDEFILYDDVQFTKNDWRNRNQIKTPQGVQWLSVPVGQDISRRIDEVDLPDPRWQAKHWKTLEANYRRAACFKDIAAWLEPFYLERQHTMLSVMNREITQLICDYLGIKTKITLSTDYQLIDGKSERLVDLCRQAGATEYVSGPSAKSYLQEDLFAEKNIAVTWFDYAGYQPYAQLWGDFVHGVTILDLLFNCGENAADYMRYVRP